MDSLPKSSPLLLIRFLAWLVPAFLGLYWLIYVSHPAFAVLAFRPAILAACMALSLLWYRAPVTRAEKELAGVLAILCFVLLAPSLSAIDPGRALQAWLKLVIVCGIAIMSCRALRHPAAARVFGISLILASVVLGALMIVTYVSYMGMVAPTYGAARIFKGHAAQAGIPLNNIAFDCLFAYVCGMCLLRNTKALWAVGLVLLVISSVLTGSRAPLAILALSGLALLTINALRSRRLLVWVGGGLLAIAVVVGAGVVIATASSSDMSAFTEGRWELWSVALHKFTQQPILGYGYSSVEDDPTYIPGGYHSEYLTALAEQGAVGTTAVLGLFWFLLRRCWGLAFRRSYTWHNGQWALLGCLFLLVRATVEADGLFGFAQGPADFLAYIFLATVISRFSLEEDYLNVQRGTYGSISNASHDYGRTRERSKAGVLKLA